MKQQIYKGTVCISDSEFRYAYMVEARVTDSHIERVRLYFPDFSPEAYDKHPTYFLNISYFDGPREVPLILSSFDRSEALACTPISNDRNTYYEYIDFYCDKPLTTIDRLYVSLTPAVVSDDRVRADLDYNSGQSALVENTSDIAAKFVFEGKYVKLVPVLSGTEFKLSNDYLSSIYGKGDYFIQYHVFVAGTRDIYEAIESNIYPVNDVDDASWSAPQKAAEIEADIMSQFSNESNVDTSHDRWEPGLKLTGTIVIYKAASGVSADQLDDGIVLVPVEGEKNNYVIKTGLDQINALRGAPTSNGFDIPARDDDKIPPYKFPHVHVVKFAGLMTDPLPITQELYAQWCYGSNKEINIKDMEIIQPRIINKTINNVYEITSKTDPHANIVQPVFFKVRDLANIVVHPDVTENICINLDAYKSQCSSFMLKIEGTIFNETARVEAGVVFKIRSNMLPGKVDSGIYYILNQDAELVTTGKYYYER